jgi:hypothetical protein
MKFPFGTPSTKATTIPISFLVSEKEGSLSHHHKALLVGNGFCIKLTFFK